MHKADVIRRRRSMRVMTGGPPKSFVDLLVQECLIQLPKSAMMEGQRRGDSDRVDRLRQFVRGRIRCQHLFIPCDDGGVMRLRLDMMRFLTHAHSPSQTLWDKITHILCLPLLCTESHSHASGASEVFELDCKCDSS